MAMEIGDNMNPQEILPEEDGDLFYDLLYPLFDFVNKEYRICPEFETIDEDTDTSATKVITDYLWSHTRAIDFYLSEAELPDEYAQIIAGWKQCKAGVFVLERHLQQGSVFISKSDHKVYMVKNRFSTWQELLGKAPVELVTTLLPSRDCIVSDGLLVPYSDYFSNGERRVLKSIYTEAKGKGKICFSLAPKKKWKPHKNKKAVNVESYVIQVDIGTDCCRHIRIGKQETLKTLHGAILDAFGFDDNHCYAFFMDDRYRSKTDVYYSNAIYDGGPSECDATLRQLWLKKGNKFKFLFDFGANWWFQCRVLQELEEKTDIPAVIKAVGAPPEQYPSWEDDD